MDYPNNFNIPAFPAGKTIALARSVSIWISIVFFLIIAACGFFLLGIHLKKNFPFLISIDSLTGEWVVVTYPGEHEKSIPQYQYIQEKLVHDFVKDWFTISANQNINEDIWKRCSVDECNAPEQFNPTNKVCALSCKASSTLFDIFTSRVLTDYKARIAQADEKWTPRKNIIITPKNVSESHSIWQVYTTINSSVNGNFDVLVFVDIERDINLYPSTFGYYINQFNAYRVTQ